MASGGRKSPDSVSTGETTNLTNDTNDFQMYFPHLCLSAFIRGYNLFVSRSLNLFLGVLGVMAVQLNFTEESAG